jgi:hypothetical protein
VGRRPVRISQAIIEFETRLRENEPLRKIVDKAGKDLGKHAEKE